MIKGDKRKAQILAAAEALFLEKGYENTSIQDILDCVSLSKGGFYHHFNSKDELLDEICTQRAEVYASHTAEELQHCPPSPTARLNAFFDRSLRYSADLTDCIGLEIQIAHARCNHIMREVLAAKQNALLLPPLEEIVTAGVAASQFYTVFPNEICRVLLGLYYAFVQEVALYLLSCGLKEPSSAALLAMLQLYRNAFERLLDAPFGSLTLFGLEPLTAVCMTAWRKHVRPLFAPREEFDVFTNQ